MVTKECFLLTARIAALIASGARDPRGNNTRDSTSSGSDSDDNQPLVLPSRAMAPVSSPSPTILEYSVFLFLVASPIGSSVQNL